MYVRCSLSSFVINSVWWCVIIFISRFFGSLSVEQIFCTHHLRKIVHWMVESIVLTQYTNKSHIQSAFFTDLFPTVYRWFKWFYWIISYFIVIIFIASIRSNRINKSKLIFWLFYLIRAVFILSSTHLWYLLSIARLLRYALVGRLSKIVIHFEWLLFERAKKKTPT